MEHLRSLEQQSASTADCLVGNKSELSHLNDGIATVRVSHYTQCIARLRRVGYVVFNNDGTTTVRVSHYTQRVTA